MILPFPSQAHFDLFGGFGDMPEAFRLYYALFQQLTSTQELANIRGTRIKNWFNGEYRHKVVSRIVEQEYDPGKRKMRYAEALYVCCRMKCW